MEFCDESVLDILKMFEIFIPLQRKLECAELLCDDSREVR